MELNRLRSLWKETGFRPKKRLGQNFLIDNNVRDKILSSAHIPAGSHVVEIGAGFGVMSLPIMDMDVRLFAVEKDDIICGMMKPFFEDRDNAELINADVMDLDLNEYKKEGERITVVGNIPYYISTPIISRVIESRDVVNAAYLVMQDEVASRVVSMPGSRIYGSFSCFVQFYSAARKLFKIKKNCFYPRPQVDSSLVEIKILDSPSVEVRDEVLMFRIIRSCFSQRRKKLLNPLSASGLLGVDRKKWESLLEASGIGLSSRAEELSLEQYARLSDNAMP